MSALARAKRWAARLPACAARSEADEKKCYRRMMDAFYGALAPRRDGTHPLDHHRQGEFKA